MAGFVGGWEIIAMNFKTFLGAQVERSLPLRGNLGVSHDV